MIANSEQIDRIGAIHGVMPNSQQLPPAEDDFNFASFEAKPAMLSTTVTLRNGVPDDAQAMGSTTANGVAAGVSRNRIDLENDSLVSSALVLMASNSLSGQEEGARMAASLSRTDRSLRQALIRGGAVGPLTKILVRDSATMSGKEHALGALALLTEPMEMIGSEESNGDLPSAPLTLPVMRQNGVWGGLATNVDAFVAFELRDEGMLADPASMLEDDLCDTLCALLWILRAKGRVGEFRFSELCRERAALALANISCNDRARSEAVGSEATTMCAELLTSASGDRKRNARCEALGALSVLLRERDARIELVGGFADELLGPGAADDRPAHFGLIALIDALSDHCDVCQERAAAVCCHITVDRECCSHIATLEAAEELVLGAGPKSTDMVSYCIRSLVQMMQAPSSSNLGRRLSLAALAGIANATTVCWAIIKEEGAVSCIRELLQTGTLAEIEEAVRCVRQIADSTATDPKLSEHCEELLELLESGENNDDIFFGDGVKRPAYELNAAFNMVVPGQSRARKELPVHIVQTPW